MAALAHFCIFSKTQRLPLSRWHHSWRTTLVPVADLNTLSRKVLHYLGMAILFGTVKDVETIVSTFGNHGTGVDQLLHAGQVSTSDRRTEWIVFVGAPAVHLGPPFQQ